MTGETEMPEPQSDAESPGVDPAVLEFLPELVKFANSVADAARRPSLRYFVSNSSIIARHSVTRIVMVLEKSGCC